MVLSCLIGEKKKKIINWIVLYLTKNLFFKSDLAKVSSHRNSHNITIIKKHDFPKLVFQLEELYQSYWFVK